MLDTSIYTIGWVCAIHVELVAAQLHLDTRHDDTEYVAAPNDNNTYVFGSIRRHNIVHNVVIACLPSGEYGVGSAASVARDMIRTFTNVKIGLMVGIAGGAPLMETPDEQEQDVRLGDVVVSVPGNGRGGIHQYDFGKAVQGKEFKMTGHLNSPPISIRTAVNALRADMTIEGNTVDEDVQALLHSNKRLRKQFTRPDVDQLFVASYSHIEGQRTCSQCSSDRLVVRPQRDEEDIVTIHYGLVASANTVMKNAETRNALAKDGVLCFEMEAAGLMNQLPFLVIRGICDYSDTHKNKDWQGYAAMTAAAYTKKLLLKLTPAKVETEKALIEIKEIREMLQDATQKVEQVHELAIDHGLQQWLSATDPSTNYNRALGLRHPGSGAWLFDDSLDILDTAPMIWLHGISGCGKTVLAASIIERFQDVDNNQAMIYFYFDFQDSVKQTFDNMVRSLVKQLYTLNDHCRGALSALYELCLRANQPTERQLVDCLRNMLKGLQSVRIVLDALDECNDRRKVFAWLEETMRTVKTAQIIITSRPEHDIEKVMKQLLPKEAIIPVNAKPVNQDIKGYIKHRLKHDVAGFGRWHARSDVQQLIEDSLMKKAGGMFRWAACQLDALSDCIDLGMLEAALNSLPSDLHETYSRTLQRIPDQLRLKTIRILQFLAFSERPLTCQEIIDALAVSQGDGVLSFDTGRRMPDSSDLTMAASSLVAYTSITTDRTNEVKVQALQLAHLSVKEYLQDAHANDPFERELNEASARSMISEICLSYLLDIQHDLELEELCEKYPFAPYCAQYWPTHAASLALPNDRLRKTMQRFFAHQRSFSCFLKVLHEDQCADDSTPLYCAAYYGIDAAVADLIEHGVELDAQGGERGNALQTAAYRGHVETVKILISKGADVNLPGPYGDVFYPACFQGHHEIVKLLLDHGIKLTAKRYADSFWVAAYNGHGQVTELLLTNIAMHTSRMELCEYMLMRAAERGHDGMLDRLLTEYKQYNNALASAEGIPTNSTEVVSLSTDESVTTVGLGGALYMASWRGYTHIVRTLIANGAAVNSLTTSAYGFALQAAALAGSGHVVAILLDAGADVNIQGGEFGQALQAAAYRDHDIVLTLLGAGADVNASGGKFGSALQAAASQGQYDTVVQLLHQGADAQAAGGLFGNALQAASAGGHSWITELLLERGADVNARGGRFDNALHAAACHGRVEIVKLLLTRGADANLLCQTGNADLDGTPLYAAASHGYSEIVSILLAHGADPNVSCGPHGTALLAALQPEIWSNKAAMLLIEHDASMKIRHGESTALELALRRQDAYEVVRLLLDRGADVNDAPSGYSIALESVIQKHGESSELARLLLSRGARRKPEAVDVVD